MIAFVETQIERTMVYLFAALSAVVTGSLFALGVRVVFGIEHAGILFAMGVIGGGLQTAALILWYLHHTARRTGATGTLRDQRD